MKQITQPSGLRPPKPKAGMDELKHFKKAVFAESFDLDKFGWTKSQDGEAITAYIVDYFRDNYGIGIDRKLALSIGYTIDSALSEAKKARPEGGM